MPASVLAVLACAGALACLAVGAWPRRAADCRPEAVGRAAAIAAWTGLGAALLVALLVAVGVEPAAGPPGRLAHPDALSATVLLLAAFLGVVIVRNARRHLDGHPRRGSFQADLALALGAVQALIISGDLALLAVAWIGTSLALHRLLVFFPDRQAALLAARKKFVLSRIGDAAMLAAAAILAVSVGSTGLVEVREAAEAARAAGEVPGALTAAALLLAIAAVIKSAQVPFHVWLPEVMETPTPVSALLHAGIINAGGYLVIRYADVMVLSEGALGLLVVFGAVSALFGAVVMLCQSSVKVALAWSTLAQMGFMILQCGLGAFSAAGLHIVAHALYKAHAFLSAGSVLSRPGVEGADAPVRTGRLALWLAAGAAGAVALAQGFGFRPAEQPGVVLFGVVLAFGLVHLLWTASAGGTHRAGARVGAALAVGAGTAFCAAQAGAAVLLADLPEAARPAAPFTLGAAVLFCLLAALVVLAQAELPRRAGDPRWQAAYVHLANGLYLGVMADRLIRSLWPVRPALAARHGAA